MQIVPRVCLFSQSWKQSQILESKRCIFKSYLFSYWYWGKTLSDNNFDMLVFIETTKFLELFFSTSCAWIHKPTNSHAHQILYCPHFETKDLFFGNISLVVVGEKGYFMMWEGRSVCSESRVLWYLTTRSLRSLDVSSTILEGQLEPTVNTPSSHEQEHVQHTRPRRERRQRKVYDAHSGTWVAPWEIQYG